LLCSLLAHNLSRELQMQVEEPVRGTTQKRTVKWLFEGNELEADGSVLKDGSDFEHRSDFSRYLGARS
jgi:hypothetical protein